MVVTWCIVRFFGAVFAAVIWSMAELGPLMLMCTCAGKRSLFWSVCHTDQGGCFTPCAGHECMAYGKGTANTGRRGRSCKHSTNQEDFKCHDQMGLKTCG